MNSRIMQASIREMRRQYFEQQQTKQKLEEVCEVILSYPRELEAEIFRVRDFLNTIEELVIQYDEKSQSMVSWHSKVIEQKNKELIIFEKIAKLLKELGDDAVEEFFGGVDFFDFIEKISKGRYKLENLRYVFKAQNVITDIKYQFERIYNTDDRAKQIVILQGMTGLF